MFAPQDTPDKLVDVIVDDVVVRRQTGVPQVEAIGEKSASREEHHPFGSAELGRRDLLPGDPSDLGEHGDAVEAVDRMILLRGLGQDTRIEQIGARTTKAASSGSGSPRRWRCFMPQPSARRR